MSWVFLGLAILLDVLGTIFLKLSNGLSRLTPTFLMFTCYALAFVPLSAAVRVMPVSVVYAIWSALGTGLVVAIGILWFHEPATVAKLLSIGLIIVGMVCLHLSSKA